MSRRFCGIVLCGLACLTAGLSSVSDGCDCQTMHTVGMTLPSYGGFAMAPQMMSPMMQQGGISEDFMDPGMMGPPTGGPLGAGAGKASLSPAGV